MVDYASQIADLSDATKLGAYLDKSISEAKKLSMDGFAFTGTPLFGGSEAEQAWRKEAAQLIVSKLSAATEQNKILVFEGDPAFVNTADRAKIDYIVLNTTDIDNITELKLWVRRAIGDNIIEKNRVLLSAKIGNQITDENNVKQEVLPYITDKVASLGPLGGLAIYGIGDDYYHARMNYESTREAIQLMNPSN